MRTFTVDPQEGTRRSPFFKRTTLGKPRRGSVMVLIERNVVVC